MDEQDVIALFLSSVYLAYVSKVRSSLLMEFKIDRYTKVVLTLIAVALLVNAFKNNFSDISTPFNPQSVQA